jgi:hypothetical protein
MVISKYLINPQNTLTWENFTNLYFIVPILKFYNLQLDIPHYRIYSHRPITGYTDLRVCRVYDTVYQLSCHLPRPLSSFPYVTGFFFLPAFHFGRNSVFGHRPVRLLFEILLSAWGFKTCFGLSDCERAILLVFPGLRCFLCLVDQVVATPCNRFIEFTMSLQPPCLSLSL